MIDYFAEDYEGPVIKTRKSPRDHRMEIAERIKNENDAIIKDLETLTDIIRDAGTNANKD